MPSVHAWVLTAGSKVRRTGRHLMGLLERRFGPLDEPIRQRVRTADAETLLQWGERILTAATLAEVVGE